MIKHTTRVIKVHLNRARYGTYHQELKHTKLLLQEEVQGRVASHEILEKSREIGVEGDVQRNGVIVRKLKVEEDD
jgi:hypothetical protein